MGSVHSWTADSTTITAANFNKHLDRSHVNILRGSFFESWSEGPSAAPDGWLWQAGTDGVLAQESTSSFVQWGNYSTKVTKTAGDSTYSILEQSLTTLHLPTGYYTVCGRVHCNVASGVALFIHDGSTYNVTSTHTGGGSFETLSATFNISSYSTFKVGAIYYQVDGAVSYVDSMALYRGECAPYYSPNPADFAPICQSWDNDTNNSGTYDNVHAGVRYEPFAITGTLTGGALQEKIDFTLHHGCQKILAVLPNAISFGTTDAADVTVTSDQYGGGSGETTFDLNIIKHTAGNLTASEAFEIRGLIIMLGWDAGTEVYGD